MMSAIQFKAQLEQIGSQAIVRLPESASAKLPSRGMAMVEGTINDFAFLAPLEPDGQGSHWLKVNKAMRKGAGADVGDTVALAIEPVEDWPEPDVPADLEKALKANPQALATWEDTTPIARWDWIRSIGSTKNAKTRSHRIEVACSKLADGQRRQCCFNRSQCTDPAVSRNGVLLPADSDLPADSGSPPIPPIPSVPS